MQQLRKVQEMGGATLLVSLPKEWVRASSLKKGNLVSIENSGDGGLLIYPAPESQDSRSEREIDIEYPSRFGNPGLSNEIIGAYLLGYDLIQVKGKHRISSKDRESIVGAIKGLIGLEVVEENAQNITSQFLVDNKVVEPSKIFRRISSIVRAMISDSVKHLSSGEAKFESVAQRDDEVDRLHFLLVRLIRSAIRDPRAAGKFGLSTIDCLDYRVAASSLETAGDYAVELSNAIAKLDRVESKVRIHLSKINESLDLIQDGSARSFIGKDYTIARSVLGYCDDLDKMLADFRASNQNQMSFAGLLHLADIFERISRCQRDIADLVAPMQPA
ncbi:MAG TPA: phosphate uptake regulator PhoU [Nitrososphaerales archaeon]|nr:phosphate uptake regulator PhoU [Nitrososphaerales archaeon]